MEQQSFDLLITFCGIDGEIHELNIYDVDEMNSTENIINIKGVNGNFYINTELCQFFIYQNDTYEDEYPSDWHIKSNNKMHIYRLDSSIYVYTSKSIQLTQDSFIYINKKYIEYVRSRDIME